MPTVLLITFDYPPGYHVGAERMVKFEKYLSDFGFRTCVLTTGTNNDRPWDEARRVYRAFDPGQLYLSIARRLHPWWRSSEPEDNMAKHAVSAMKELIRKSLSGLRGWVDGMVIPDLQIGWLPLALWMGFKAIKREKVDAILSSSRPETPHLVAAILSKITRVPWVADFRDGWLYEPLKGILRRQNLRRRLEQNLERVVVSKAGAVVSVSQPMTEYFRATYPALKHKFKTIPNGYDPEDWQDVKPLVTTSHKFRLVYTGRLTLSRPTLDHRPFLQALQALGEEVRSKMEVLWVGELADKERTQLFLPNIKNVMKVSGQVSRMESLAYQMSADCLLLFVGKDKSVNTSKLFEYLYARRPILAISASDTAAAAIIEQTGAGEVVDPDDPQAIAACLNRLFQRWQRGGLSCSVRGIECYERRELTRQLAEILRSVISNTAKGLKN